MLQKCVRIEPRANTRILIKSIDKEEAMWYGNRGVLRGGNEGKRQ